MKIDFKKEIERVLKKHIKEVKIEIPPQDKFGEYSVPLFEKDINDVKKIKIEIEKDKKISEYFSKINVVGKYLNFFINEDALKSKVFSEEPRKLKADKFKDEIVFEYVSPNTNKPLHLGHAFQMTIGNALCNLLEFTGTKTRRVCLINDRGIHICQSMIAYQKFGKNSNPESEAIKSDHFVGKYYVLFNQEKIKNPKIDEEARELLEKYENEDKNTIALWKKMNSWALQGINETFERFGVEFEKFYYESNFYQEGKKIALDGLKKGIFSKDENSNIVADLEDKGLGKKVILRADGTAVYATQDIVLAQLKKKDFSKASKLIVLVGNEQNTYFAQLKEILKLLNYKINLEFLGTGIINLPEGRMKSREGKVVDADHLLDLLKDLAKFKVKEHLEETAQDVSDKEVDRRSEKIALAALKFFLLSYDFRKDSVFDPEKNISFQGDTGPYVLYTLARINSIIRSSPRK